MNIVFFGSSNFAVTSLKALLTSGHKVSCVVTQPDKQKGRGLYLAGTAIKTISLESGLKIYQPDNINTAESVEFLKDLNPDLFVVIAYGQILCEGILNTPKILPLNIHASILPKYRGAAPVNWAIINAEKTTGVSIIKMTSQMDAGPIISQNTLNIEDDDTSISLEEKLSHLAAELLLVSLQDIEKGNYKLSVQDQNNITFAPKLKKEDGRISWNRPARGIYNLIRGCLPWPGTFTYYKGKLLKIYKGKVCPLARLPVSPLPGKIINISKDGIVVSTGKDNLRIEGLQIEGKRIMKADEFVKGNKICIGDILE